MPRFDVLSGLPPYGEEAFPFRVVAEHPIAGDALTLKRSDAPETLLTCMCMTMFAEAFKLPCGQDILERLLRPKARGAARHALEFESLASLHDNLQAPSRYLVEVMSGGLTVRGAEHIPTCGPVLITCNHPGIFDAMVVFASLPRTDVKVIARPRNLLDVLPNVRRHIIFVPDDPAGGTGTLRESLRHLADGGLLVTFPRGRIEPDPLLHRQAAIESVAQWSSSVNLLAKHVAGLSVIPAAVGGMGMMGRLKMMKALASGGLNNLGMPGGPMLKTKKSGWQAPKDRNKKKKRR